MTTPANIVLERALAGGLERGWEIELSGAAADPVGLRRGCPRLAVRWRGMAIAKRTILEALTRPELLAIAEAYELHVEDRRVRDQLIQAAAASRKVDLGAVLGDFSRDRLKELCRELGHDDSGKEKAPIVARLLGMAPRPDADEDPEDHENDDSLEAAPPEQTPDKRGKRSAKKAGGGDFGFEATLWQAADKLRNNMDAAEYKHVVLGLIFLKYISDAFEELHARLVAQAADGADPEDRDEYKAERVFWVPRVARWSAIQARAKTPAISSASSMAGRSRASCSSAT